MEARVEDKKGDGISLFQVELSKHVIGKQLFVKLNMDFENAPTSRYCSFHSQSLSPSPDLDLLTYLDTYLSTFSRLVVQPTALGLANR